MYLYGLTAMTILIIPILALARMRERVPPVVVGVRVVSASSMLHIAATLVVQWALAGVNGGAIGMVTLEEVAPGGDR